MHSLFGASPGKATAASKEAAGDWRIGAPERRLQGKRPGQFREHRRGKVLALRQSAPGDSRCSRRDPSGMTGGTLLRLRGGGMCLSLPRVVETDAEVGPSPFSLSWIDLATAVHVFFFNDVEMQGGCAAAVPAGV